VTYLEADGSAVPSQLPARAAAPESSPLVRDLNWKLKTWLLLVVLCGALFLDALDLSMIGVALPSIGTSLHLSADALQWIVSGYILGYGSLLLLGGRASDLLDGARCSLPPWPCSVRPPWSAHCCPTTWR